MKVISVEKFKGATYKAEFDEAEPIFMNLETVLAEHIKTGAELSEERYTEIAAAAALRTAKERALYLLENRDYSFKELFEKLNNNYDDETCLAVCVKMAETGLINDRRYAEKLAEKYVEIKHFGSYRAKNEMSRHGLSAELISEALSRYEDDTAKRLGELIERKYASKIIDRKSAEKVKAALVRQGYSFSDINAAMEEYISRLKDEGEY